MIKPISAFIKLFTSDSNSQRSSNTQTQFAKQTFGQKHQDRLNTQYKRATDERRKLYRAQAASSDPVSAAYGQRAGMVERRIDQLHAEIKQQNDSNSNSK